MGKDAFLKKLHDEQDQMESCYGVIDIKKHETLMSSAYIVDKMITKFYDVAKKELSTKDLYKGYLNVAKNNKDFASSFYYSIDSILKKQPKLRDEVVTLLNTNIDKTLEERLEIIVNHLADLPENEENKKLNEELQSSMRAKLAVDHKNLNIAVVNAFIEGCDLPDDKYPDEKEFTTSFESPDKAYRHPFENEINELIKEEQNNLIEDRELIESLNIANNILIEPIEEGSFLSDVAEEQGKHAAKVFDIEYSQYQKENNVTFVEKVNINDPHDLIEYSKNNIIGEVKHSDKYKETMARLIQHVIDKKYDVTFVSEIFGKDARDLANAIKNKDTVKIKELAKVLDEKEKDVDSMIKELKELDPMHMFNENMASSREIYYPGKYRVDYEGATLMNHVLNAALICKERGINPVDLMNDPIGTSKQAYKDFYKSKDNPFNKCFSEKNPFAIINKVTSKSDQTLIDALGQCAIQINNNFGQLSPTIAINNSENRYETFHRLSSDIVTTMNLYGENIISIRRALTSDGNIVFKDLLPKLVMMGNDFNPQKHINAPGMIDEDTKDFREPYDIQDYLKGMTAHEMFTKYKNAYETFDSNYRGKLHSDSFEIGLETIEDEVTNTLENRGISRSVSELYFKSIRKEVDLTPMQINTVTAAINMANTKEDNLYEKVKTIADLESKYKSHNGLARFLFPKLRQQKELLNDMKQSLVNKGYNLEAIEAQVLGIKNGTIREEDFVLEKDPNVPVVEPTPRVLPKLNIESRAKPNPDRDWMVYKEKPFEASILKDASPKRFPEFLEKRRKELEDEAKKVSDEQIKEAVDRQVYKDPRGYTVFNIDSKLSELEEALVGYVSSQEKASIERYKTIILSSGLTTKQLKSFKNECNSDKGYEYFHAKKYIDIVRQDFLEKDRSNDNKINQTLSKPSTISRKESDKRNKNIDTNLHIDSIAPYKAEVMFEGKGAKDSKKPEAKFKLLSQYLLIGERISRDELKEYQAEFKIQVNRDSLIDFLKKMFDNIPLNEQHEILDKYGKMLAEAKKSKQLEQELDNDIKENSEDIIEDDNEEELTFGKMLEDKKNSYGEKEHQALIDLEKEEILNRNWGKVPKIMLLANKRAEFAQYMRTNFFNESNEELILKNKLAGDDVAYMNFDNLINLVTKREFLFNALQGTTKNEDKLINKIKKMDLEKVNREIQKVGTKEKFELEDNNFLDSSFDDSASEKEDVIKTNLKEETIKEKEEELDNNLFIE